MDKRLKNIRAFHLWSELPDPLWSELSAHMSEIDCPAGEILFPTEQTERCLCVLLEGQASVYAPCDSSESKPSALLRTMSGGEVFGVHCIFQSDMSPQSTIIASKRCRVLTVPAARWEQALTAHPATMARYVRFLSERVQFLNRKIRYLSAGSAERRLSLYLLSEIPKEGVCVRLPLSAVAMSDLLALGRASLYRAMTRLSEDGFLVRSGHYYCLHDRDRLADFYR